MKSHPNEIVKAPPVKVHRTLEGLLTAVRACRACDAHLPFGARPVSQAGATASVLIHFLRSKGHASVTATTRDWRAHAPGIIPLPHPSPRNIAWFIANPWFDNELLPVLRRSVRKLVTAR